MAGILAPNSPLPGQHIVETLITEGRVAQIYRVRAKDGSARAAHVLRTEHCPDLGAWFVERAKARRSLEHPNVPRTYHVGALASGEPVEITELLTGRTLRHLLQQSDAGLDLPQAGRIVGALGDVLDYLHRRPIPVVHRALSPERVFLRARDNALRLLDVGVGDRPRIEAAPAAYKSPEDLAGLAKIGPRADVFCLASLAYEMLTGRVAFVDGPPPNPSPEALPSVHARRAEVPAAVDALLAEAWTTQPSGRPATAGTFAARFADALGLARSPSTTQAHDSTTREVSIPAVARGRRDTLLGSGVLPRAAHPPRLGDTTLGAPPGTRPFTPQGPEAVVPPDEGDPTPPTGFTAPEAEPPPDDDLLPTQENLAAGSDPPPAPISPGVSLFRGDTQPMFAPGAFTPAPAAPEPSVPAPVGPVRAVLPAASALPQPEQGEPPSPPPGPSTPRFEPRSEEPEPEPEPEPEFDLEPAPAPHSDPSLHALSEPEPAPGPATAAPAPGPPPPGVGAPRVHPLDAVAPAALRDPPPRDDPARRAFSRDPTLLMPTLSANKVWHRTPSVLAALLLSAAIVIVGLGHAAALALRPAPVLSPSPVAPSPPTASAPAACPPCPVCPACPACSVAPAAALPAPAARTAAPEISTEAPTRTPEAPTATRTAAPAAPAALRRRRNVRPSIIQRAPF